MNINFEKARELMVENQLKPNKIKDPIIINLFKNTKKEDFLSGNIKETSYSDLDINLDTNRGYLKNLHLAQLIHSANIQSNQKVLHIGGLTGYVSSILANLCDELIVIESEKHLFNQLEKNIQNLSLKNIKLINSSFEDGCLEYSPYDIIFIDNPVHEINNYKDQITNDSGQIIMIKKIYNDLSKAYKITKKNNKYTQVFLFDVFSKYELYKKEENFIF